MKIPYGETTSYGALASDLGDVKASRAVGLANGSNPIPIVIPCHRVIGADGSLTAFRRRTRHQAAAPRTRAY
jgi:O-6-methylguanine DNA methyltransferase